MRLRLEMLATEHALLGLRAVASICALTSLAALVAHIAGVLPMVYFLTFFGVPAFLFLLALAAFANHLDASGFVTCLVVGVAGGVAGTIAYDGVRLLLQHSVIFNYDGFAAILIFGSWITGKATTTWQAALAGWIYHYWNGISFGIFYLLLAGKRRWWYGVGYGLVIEACMLGLFPIFLRITNKVDFIVLSMIGHVGYGAVLGWVAERYGRSWERVR